MTQLVVAIGQASIVPVQQDLTTQYAPLEILRGFEQMKRVDYPMTPGVALNKGEWGCLNDSGVVTRPTGTAVQATYLCFAGTEQFDSAATGAVTLLPNSLVRIQTSMYNTAGTYHVGTPLTVKDTGGGVAVVTPAAGGDPVLARCVVVPTSGSIVYDTVCT